MIEVEHLPSESRYVVTVDGVRVGRLDYATDGNTFVALHTEVDPAYGGRGLAARLVRAALDDVRANDRSLAPRCPYVRHFLTEHPEYADLVPTDWSA